MVGLAVGKLLAEKRSVEWIKIHNPGLGWSEIKEKFDEYNSELVQ